MHRFLFLLLPVFLVSATQHEPVVVILVESRDLDYSSLSKLLKTVAKHPSDYSKNGDVGHAWIYLEGVVNGKKVTLEGGHSAETGILQPRYFEGVLNAVYYGTPAFGYDDALVEWEPGNPASYLFSTQKDGFFEIGSGGHVPTYAAAIPLTDAQFKAIRRFLLSYDFSTYKLAGKQCASFAASVANLAGCPLEHEITLQLPETALIGGMQVVLWENPQYGQITFSTPEKLEESLKRAVKEGRAKAALGWYKRTHRPPFKKKWDRLWETIRYFPERFTRYLQL